MHMYVQSYVGSSDTKTQDARTANRVQSLFELFRLCKLYALGPPDTIRGPRRQELYTKFQIKTNNFHFVSW